MDQKTPTKRIGKLPHKKNKDQTSTRWREKPQQTTKNEKKKKQLFWILIIKSIVVARSKPYVGSGLWAETLKRGKYFL